MRNAQAVVYPCGLEVCILKHSVEVSFAAAVAAHNNSSTTKHGSKSTAVDWDDKSHQNNLQ